MRPGRRFASFVLLVSLGFAAAAVAGEAPPPIPIPHAGFEEAGPAGETGIPAGWQVVGELPAGASVARDPEVAFAGGASLRLASEALAEITVASEPVALTVGRVYLLRARVRTAEVVSDPLARYPTAVPACLAMASFPFTNHSPAAGATRDWHELEMRFVATRAADRVTLHLGRNGGARGTVWFDDLTLEEVTDVADWIPLETVRWAGPAWRAEQGGWLLVHIEGEPYQRGYQHGYLLAEEIAAYLEKLTIVANAKDPAAGWAAARTLADATMLRGYSEELLTEMRGIADGAAKGGAKLLGRAVDFLDVVTMNSTIDTDYLRSGLVVLPNALTGRSFLTAEEELAIPEGTHKCSALTATGDATADGRVVFGQIFMWSGYTGVHFNVLLDIVPATGRRLVYQTFPGGIHSGTDFYMNDAGIVIGETTVMQTPWNRDGAPMSDRIRRAVQYGTSIDEVTAILAERNNGMYANDWPMADVKTDETAILLLGTAEKRLWRSGENPFGTGAFLWANNNPRDPRVRREYAHQPQGAPFDPVFAPWNRDLAFNEYYRREKGKIDAPSLARAFATSPINLSHACDGKITTSEMAEQLVFWAHQGKVTLREKFPAPGNRRMPDLPGARPHLTLGYTAVTPIWLAEQLAAAKAAGRFAPAATAKEPKLDLTAVKERFALSDKQLWQGTLFPAGVADHWLASGTAGYWQVLRGLPADEAERAAALGEALARQNSLLLATLAREEDLPAARAELSYTRYAPYRVARVKGTFALHQLRLQLGTEPFLKLMRTVHERYADKEIATADFLAVAREVTGRDVAPILTPWLERTGFPAPAPRVSYAKDGKGWRVTVTVTQPAADAYPLATSVEIETAAARVRHPLLLSGPSTSATFRVAEKPVAVRFDPGYDLALARSRWAAWAHVTERWPESLVVHGTTRADEAQHTLARNFQTVLADNFSEELIPVVKDVEVSAEQLATRDLILLGGPADNALTARVLAALGEQVPAAFGDGHFRFRGATHGRGDEGLFLALPSPFAPDRLVYLFAANSALELHEMTRTYTPGLPAWVLYRGEKATARGYFDEPAFVFAGP